MLHFRSLMTRFSCRQPALYFLLIILVVMHENGASLTRWSSVQFVPDADFLGAGSIVISAQGYSFSDIEHGTSVIPSAFVNLGIIEWVNLEAGYAGGPSFGLKARILGETRPWMPSLAVGARNIFTHREAYLFDRAIDSLGSEFYLVFAKSLDALRLRFHIGVQSIPDVENEKVSPVAAIEKYFGAGLYVSIEAFFREKEIHPCVFASWRFLKKKCELSTGVIDITGMFINKGDVPSNSPFYESAGSKFVRPGIWLGFRFNGGMKIGKAGGFTGIENSLNNQSASINTLRMEVDSLKNLLKRSSSSIETLNRTMMQITDSSRNDQQRFKALAEEKLAQLNTLYSAEPFDPEAVNSAMATLIAARDDILPALYDIIIDPVKETRIRALAISALGEIGSQAAADIVIGLLGQSTIPEITIECLIALGKMKDTRAVYVMQQLSNDPNDDVAFTASEVLQKLEKETGVSTTPVSEPRQVPTSVPEKPIGGEERIPAKQPDGKLKEQRAVEVAPPVPSPVKAGPITSLEKPEFQEATVTGKSGTDSSLVKESISGQVKPVPEASMKPQPAENGTVEVVSPIKPQAEKELTVETLPQKPPVKTIERTPGNVSQGSPASDGKKEKKKTPKKKTIDTSSDTW